MTEKSGRFVVRIPKSLHAALARQAKTEGVSLNQLVVSILSVPLKELLAGKEEVDTDWRRREEDYEGVLEGDDE